MMNVHGILTAVLGLMFLVVPHTDLFADEQVQNEPTEPEHEEEPNHSTVYGRGGLFGFSGDELDLMGHMQIETVPPKFLPQFRLELDTLIEKTSSDATFDVRELNYKTQINTIGLLGLAAGEWGKVPVDDSGHQFVRWLGVGLLPGSSIIEPTYPFQFELFGGWVFDESGLDSTRVLFSKFEFVGKRFSALMTSSSLYGDTSGTDWTFGVGYNLPWSSKQSLQASLRYVDSNHPLGLLEDGFLLGFELIERPLDRPADSNNHTELPLTETTADFFGEVAAGISDHPSGRFLAGIRSPKFFDSSWHFAFVVDAHAVDGDADNDLYYFYHLGPERVWHNLYRVGAWFYHRSNHRFDNFGDSVTSLNIFETGIETLHWEHPHRAREHWAWRIRLGATIDSDFGDAWDPNLRGGVRWHPRPELLLNPFLQVQGELGLEERLVASVGISHVSGYLLRLEYTQDDQWFRQEEEHWALVAAFGF